MIATESSEGQAHAAYSGPERRECPSLRRAVSRMSREELEHELLVDPLTEIPNRRTWAERTPQVDETVIMIDVDSLKFINDEIGHAAGDELLRQVGSLLQHLATTQNGACFRLSGDEFLLVLPPDVSARQLGRATYLLQNFPKCAIGWKDAAGVGWAMMGLTLTYGVGPTLATADAAMLSNKQLRCMAGLRAARGERPAGLKIERMKDPR